jgi:hypothetical protein
MTGAARSNRISGMEYTLHAAPSSTPRLAGLDRLPDWNSEDRPANSGHSMP